MKLYKYSQDCGRMGSIEGVFFLEPDEAEFLSQYNLSWDELLGKHSEGYYDFSDETLTEIVLPDGIASILYNAVGKVLSGPFDFDYFKEQIEEFDEESMEDKE
jgi:hypothetical protein